MNPCPELFSAKSQPIEAEEIIVISEKELLALVAAIDTRVERAGEMQIYKTRTNFPTAATFNQVENKAT
jgi:hypothetical protein